MRALGPCALLVCSVAIVACSGAIESPPDVTTRMAVAPNEAALSEAKAALVGKSFRVREVHIGGSPAGTAPSHYRERVVGEVMKVCFGDFDLVTVCECTEPRPASVFEIETGDEPSFRCAGPVACSMGRFSFDAEGKLIVDAPGGESGKGIATTSLTWALHPRSTYALAGRVTLRPEGTYVDGLAGLGQALLEPIQVCP